MDSPARQIITKFGGIRPLATALGHKNASTVQGWWDRETIPSKRQETLLALAAELGIALAPADFFKSGVAA